ncbi:MAG: hypothetical protein J5793_01045, partial [Clostridia bacterium]|nr:hypothetical protein [Clostridia bacterium]
MPCENGDFDKYLSEIKGFFADCDDLAARLGTVEGGRFALIYLKEVCSRDYISQNLVKPLLKKGLKGFNGDPGCVISASNFTVPKDAAAAADGIAIGEAVLLV